MKVSTRTPWVVATIVMTIVATTAVVFAVEKSPEVSLKSSGCTASAISMSGGPVLGAGGTDGDEFQLRYSGSGYCLFSGYPVWNFFNTDGVQITNGTSALPATDLFGGSGTSIATQLVRFDSSSPVSTAFEYFYSEGSKSQDGNPPSCMVSYGSLELPLADDTGVITIKRVPLSALKLNFCLVKLNMTVTPVEGTPWPHQTESRRPTAPYRVDVRTS